MSDLFLYDPGCNFVNLIRSQHSTLENKLLNLILPDSSPDHDGVQVDLQPPLLGLCVHVLALLPPLILPGISKFTRLFLRGAENDIQKFSGPRSNIWGGNQKFPVPIGTGHLNVIFLTL